MLYGVSQNVPPETFSAKLFPANFDQNVLKSNTINSHTPLMMHLFIYIRLIQKVVRTQLNIRIQHKTSIR